MPYPAKANVSPVELLQFNPFRLYFMVAFEEEVS
jgi:hypothetical protein